MARQIGITALLFVTLSCTEHAPADCFTNRDCLFCARCVNGRCEALREPCGVEPGSTPDAQGDAWPSGDEEIPLDADLADGMELDADTLDAEFGTDTATCSTCPAELRVSSLSLFPCGPEPPVPYPIEVGVAAGASQLLISDTSRALSFDLPNLENARRISTTISGQIMLVSDLQTDRIYTLGSGGQPAIAQGSLSVDGLYELVPSALGAGRYELGPLIPTSTAIPFGLGAGLYAGPGFAVVHAGGRVYEIDFSSGHVLIDRLPPFAAIDFCDHVTGVAEHFGGQRYLVAPETVLAPVTVIKRHRVPDGATAVVAEVDGLENACAFAVSPRFSRWFLNRAASTVVAPTLSWCSATFGPGDDGITASPLVIRKEPLHGHARAVGNLEPPYTLVVANSFIAPNQASTLQNLGVWLDDDDTVGMDVVLQVWRSTNDEPDITQVVASTGVLHPVTQGVEYIEAPVRSGGLLQAAQRYWFVVSVLGVPQPGPTGNYLFPLHAQDSDGLVDAGRFKSSADPAGIQFVDGGVGSWAEMSFLVDLAP